MCECGYLECERVLYLDGNKYFFFPFCFRVCVCPVSVLLGRWLGVASFHLWIIYNKYFL